MDDVVTISLEEYGALKDDSKLLEVLVANGVDNWEGWGPSLEEWNNE